MNILITKTSAVITSFLLGVSLLLGQTPQPTVVISPEPEKLGGTYDIPTPVALFETSLATAITLDATSMTLTSALDKSGTALASSTYGFILDSGKAEEEMVIADCTGTACTNMTRGISPITGTTTVSDLRFAHRRGASVKITNGPQLLILSRILNGNGPVPNKLSYKSGTACSGSDGNQTICDKAYVDSVAVAGASDANETTKGIIELATESEARAGTSLGGTSARLVIPNSLATSSNDVATTHLVVTQTDGTIASNFIDTDAVYTLSGNNTLSGDNTFSGQNTFTATTTMATTTINGYTPKTVDVQTFTSSGTWTKPSGAKSYFVQVWAGGGGGGSAVSGGVTGGAGGGGGGGYAQAYYATSTLLGATETVTVGEGGAGGAIDSNGTAGGNSSFGSLLTAYGGSGGPKVINTTDVDGAAGGNSDVGIGTSLYAGGAGGTGGGAAAGTRSVYGGGGGGGGNFDGGAGPTTGGAGAAAYFGGAGGGGGCGGGGCGGTPAAGGAGKTGFGGAGGAGANVTASGNAAGSNATGIGGGGGGAAQVTGQGAAGGNGYRGEVRIITFF